MAVPSSLPVYLRLTSPSCVIRQAATMSSSSRILKRAFLGEDELEEVEHVARVERRGVGRHQRRQVGLADQRDAVLDHGLAGFGQRAVAALRRGQVDDHRARLHRLDHLLGDQHRRGAAGDQRGGDHDVGRGHALGDLDLLPVEPALRHRPGVAAHAFGRFLLLGGLVGHVDELGAQRLDLLLDAGPHVARPRSPRPGAWRWRWPAGRPRRRRGSRRARPSRCRRRSSASGRSAGTCRRRSSRPCSRRCWPARTARPCSARAWCAARPRARSR